ncbi:primosomal protein [Microcoleus sp. LEGE 07076]|nr:primosomal protein [Microcoleus sp. LEGE 07076]
MHKKYGVTIQRRDSRISTKVGHAIREKLGLDIQAQLNKRNGNGNGKKFDWQEWNNTVFPKLVGRPDELKYDVEVVALAMSQLYDTIADNPQAAIADLMEFNAQSLKRRNELAKSSEEDTEELDEDDDDDDEDDDILDEIDEDDDDDDEDEESDEDDDEEDDFSLDEDEEFEEDDE